MLSQSRFCTDPARADFRIQSDLEEFLPKSVCQQNNHEQKDRKRSVSSSSRFPDPESELQTAVLWCMDAADDGTILPIQPALRYDLYE